MRINDVDFDYRQIIVRDGKGQRESIAVLPATVMEPLQGHLQGDLQRHLKRVKAIHERDPCEDKGDFVEK